MSEPDPNRIDTGRTPPTQPAPPNEKPYRFPPELEPYRPYLAYAGREEELMNTRATPFNNAIVFDMSTTMRAQLGLLERLRRAGLLLPAHRAQPAQREES
ncbi:hypothetical protein [Streptomyces longwoodensis]|uniref:hypothetical protein n=1 Tax=Streptomyces longwoodensis TaxID=68231 RepID=UPI0036FBC394